MKLLKVLIMAAAVILFAACSNSTNEKNTTTHDHSNMAVNTPSRSRSISKYEIGDPVPSELVCMVNDAFMNEEQILVPVNGKDYYGCCPMCKDKLVNDLSARTAIDPVTNNRVDKADAFIAITGDKGIVSYFENENNYRTFINQLNVKK